MVALAAVARVAPEVDEVANAALGAEQLRFPAGAQRSLERELRQALPAGQRSARAAAPVLAH